MRVLHVTDFYPPTVGGLERYVQSLARQSVTSGLEVAVATQPHADLREGRGSDGVEIFALKSLTSKVLKGAYVDAERPFLPPAPDPAVTRQLREIIAEWKPDVVQSHGWISFSAASAVKASRTPLVVTLHDYGLMCATRTLLSHSKICSGPALSKCAKCSAHHYGPVKGVGLAGAVRTFRPLVGRADAFVAVSDAVARLHRPFLPTTASITVVPVFMSTEYAVAPRPDWLPTDPYVAFVGVLDAYKGVNTIMAAAELLPDQAFVVAGVPSAGTPQHTPSNVTMSFNLKHDDVMAVYRDAVAALAPSEWLEPGGTVAVEAMRVGTPVIATNLGGLPEAVVDGETGLIVPPFDPVALSQAITRITANPALRASMSHAAALRSERFTAVQVIPEMISVYERTMSASSR